MFLQFVYLLSQIFIASPGMLVKFNFMFIEQIDINNMPVDLRCVYLMTCEADTQGSRGSSISEAFSIFTCKVQSQGDTDLTGVDLIAEALSCLVLAFNI